MIILGTNSVKDTGYDVANSCRFNSGSSDYLTRTFGTPTSSQKWTLSFWVKRCKLSSTEFFFNCDGGNEEDRLQLNSANALQWFEQDSSGGTVAELVTTQLFRDVSAWYHIVIARDSTQGTASNRIKIYVNGNQVTSFSTATYPSQNDSSRFNTAVAHEIGARNAGTFVNLYMSEVTFIDGSQLDATSFGEFDEDSGIFKPIDVSGLTFGDNGFYLDFENSGALGADVSGNTNNFTVNNLTAIDQTTDTPTNNFATFNPLINTQNIPTFAEGNTQVTTTNGGVNGGYSTLGISSGKWFAEFKLTAFNTNRAVVGIVDNPSELDRTNTVIGESAYSVSYLGNGGNIVNNSSIVGSGSSYTTNDIIGVALNLDDNNILFYKNGAVQNSGTAVSITAASSTPTGFYFFAAADASTNYYATIQANFGNPAFTGTDKTDGNSRGSFEYAPPSGYLSLCTANLSEVLG